MPRTSSWRCSATAAQSPAPILTALQLLKLRGVEAAERERAIIERQYGTWSRWSTTCSTCRGSPAARFRCGARSWSLAEVVAKAIEMASPLLEQQRHELRVEVARVGLGACSATRRAWRRSSPTCSPTPRVYTESGGLVHVSADRDDGDVVLHVRDTGVGIAPEMLPRVFELFVQEGQSLASIPGALTWAHHRPQPGLAARRHGHRPQ